MSNILRCWGNVNENCLVVSYYPSQNGQGNKSKIPQKMMTDADVDVGETLILYWCKGKVVQLLWTSVWRLLKQLCSLGHLSNGPCILCYRGT